MHTYVQDFVPPLPTGMHAISARVKACHFLTYLDFWHNKIEVCVASKNDRRSAGPGLVTKPNRDAQWVGFSNHSLTSSAGGWSSQIHPDKR